MIKISKVNEQWKAENAVPLVVPFATRPDKIQRREKYQILNSSQIDNVSLLDLSKNVHLDLDRKAQNRCGLQSRMKYDKK